jgi:3-phosphoshikimate 1-carboxyvinyltransferase
VKVYPGSLNGFVRPPSSKSVSHRALILATCGEIGSQIKNPLISVDTDSTKRSLEKLGANFTLKDDFFQTIEVNQGISRTDKTPVSLNCYNSGTSLRLLSGICGLLPRTTELFGDSSLNTRPMKELAIALNQIGIKVSTDDGNPPIEITGPSNSSISEVEISGKISSQFISSLLIHGSLRGDNQLEVKVTPPIVSEPYIDLTVAMLRDLNVDIKVTDNVYTINGVDQFRKNKYQVPMDYSSAAFFIAAGAMPDNRVVIDGIDNDLPQADRKIIDIVQEMGASVNIQSSNKTKRILVEGADLTGTEINLQEAPDLFPIVSILGLVAKGETKISGAHHLAYKESNRIKSMTSVIKTLGGKIEPMDDGAIVSNSELIGGVVDSFNDHRIAMASAIAGTRSNKTVIIENSSCVNVSYPEFFIDLNRLH